MDRGGNHSERVEWHKTPGIMQGLDLSNSIFLFKVSSLFQMMMMAVFLGLMTVLGWSWCGGGGFWWGGKWFQRPEGGTSIVGGLLIWKLCK